MTTNEIIKKYELKKDKDCWIEKRSGKLCLLHSAHQKIAFKESLRVEDIKPLNSTETLVRFLVIMVRLGEIDGSVQPVDRTITIGEADTKNSFNAYLGCMAEKRGYDRAVRQLLNIDDVAFSEEDYTDKENQTYADNSVNIPATEKQINWIVKECVSKRIDNSTLNVDNINQELANELIQLICKNKNPDQEECNKLFLKSKKGDTNENK